MQITTGALNLNIQFNGIGQRWWRWLGVSNKFSTVIESGWNVHWRKQEWTMTYLPILISRSLSRPAYCCHEKKTRSYTTHSMPKFLYYRSLTLSLTDQSSSSKTCPNYMNSSISFPKKVKATLLDPSWKSQVEKSCLR